MNKFEKTINNLAVRAKLRNFAAQFETVII